MLSRNSQRVFSDEQLDHRLRAGLVGHWIGGGSGNTWFDRSGYGNHGTLTNGPTWTLGEGGKRNALQFDGTDDFVSVADSSSLDISSAISVAFWIKSDEVDSGVYSNQLVSKGSSTEDSNINFYYFGSTSGADAGKVKLTAKVGGTFQNLTNISTSALPIGTWTHVAATYSGSQGILYINGTAQGSPLSVSGTLTTNAEPLWIAKADENFTGGALTYFNGKMDDVRIYNRALSAAEISLLASPSFSPVTPRRFFLGKRASGISPANPGKFFFMFP